MLERKTSGSIAVRDVPSRNGTFIDGNRIECAELRVGSFLAVGRTTFVAVAALEGDCRVIDLIRGNDPALRTTLDQAQRAAATECNVLILGETGTGKDLLARAIHEGSRRASGAFVAVNCGALAKDLIASHLFGHEKGAFTGASETREGFFVEAHGGTLFLDRDRRAAARAAAAPVARTGDQARAPTRRQCRSTCRRADRRRDEPDGGARYGRGRSCARISIIGSRRSCSICRHCAHG